MYNGNESLINDGTYLNQRIHDFWQWAFPDLTDNTVRGTFAEYIVKTALDLGGYEGNCQSNGWEPYDLAGPIIPALNRKARIEVKCSGFVQRWAKRHAEKDPRNTASFSIAPAKMPDEIGDFPDKAARQRNNDLYVFCVYTATDHRANILDLSWWEFYVLPTQYIENHPQLYKQKTVTLKTLSGLGDNVCPKLTFNELCNKIVSVCNSIASDQVHRFPST
ncbi:MAG: hypothetical protein LUC95_12170, partial [Lachnospiraceae bacterium]|nr:hypothetical protein [Lachnospiraceae bacterium]